MAVVLSDMNHPDICKIIQEWKLQPCLYNPDARFYKNAKKKKEAYMTITKKVNQVTTTDYTVEDITNTIIHLRKEYRKCREKRKSHYLYKNLLPEAPKWWIMMHEFIKDQKFNDRILVSEGEDLARTARMFEKSIDRYLAAEKEYIASLTSKESNDKEDTGTSKKDSDSSDDSPPAKKNKEDF